MFYWPNITYYDNDCVYRVKKKNRRVHKNIEMFIVFYVKKCTQYALLSA